jgi:hypothetical protein
MNTDLASRLAVPGMSAIVPIEMSLYPSRWC